MKQHTQVVVIGGGIAGCSTLYHLTQEGITDCVMIERDELTSGTTWHSAAQVTNFSANQTMIGLKTHSINLYKEMADDPDYPINYHHGTGGLRLASTQDHMNGYAHFLSVAKGMDVDWEILDPEECKKRHPLITTDNLLGALWDPLDGDIDPAQLCQALARRARNAGAEIYRFNPVEDLTQKDDGTWIVHTKDGDISCEKIVNAGGYRCNEIGKMMGVEHPVASMEHQYMLTEDIPEIVALGNDFARLSFDAPPMIFISAEKKGLLIGFYEQDCRTWGLDGIDPNFTMALCPDDLDRVVDVMEGAFARLPCLQTAGIKSIVNGPITYTPDGLPLVGKIPGKRNAYCITGLRAGLGEGGGHGWLLAQIIAHGEACYDTWCLDPRRFTRYANEEYTALKAIEDYQNEFRFHMPHEHRPAGRPIKTTPLTPKLADMGAEFGTVNGWERALFFKPEPDFVEKHSFKFTNSFDIVRTEVENLQDNVGIMEVSGFNRYEISGKDAHDWLDNIMCSRVPRKTGRVALTYFLNHDGNVKGEATLANISDDTIWYGSAASENHDWDWLHEHLPDGSDITIKSLTNSHDILVVAGPKSRNVLQKAAPRTDWSKDAFKWLTCKKVHIGHVEAIAMAVSFSGELAWELHIANEHLAYAFDLLQRAGEEFNMKPFGLYATESMRLEKGYRHWKADLITEFDPMESDLARFVKMDKDFIGKVGLETNMKNGPRREFVSLTIDDYEAPAQPGDSILCNGNVVGTITSAAWGYRTGENIALGFIDPEYNRFEAELSVQHIDKFSPAKISEMCRYDPQNEKVRN